MMIFAMILQNNETWDPISSIITAIIFAACICGPYIGRWAQNRRVRQGRTQMQQARVQQAPMQDKMLQYWEETLLTTKDHAQKLNAIAHLGKVGTKDTLDMLSEYAEVDRDPEILAAIESALQLLEQRQIERRIKGEIEGSHGS